MASIWNQCLQYNALTGSVFLHAEEIWALTERLDENL